MSKISMRDKDIISKSFRLLSRGVPTTDILEDLDWSRQFNVFSTATGDNRYVNPQAQSNPACDPRYGRFLNTYEGGMGSMHKEIFEDNVSLLTITPGVAQFSGLLSFITNMFSPSAAIIANKGRAPSTAFYIGQAVGSIAFYPMQLMSIGLQFLSFLSDSPKNSFYTVKPAMGAYTMAANGVLNDIMVKLGWVDPVLPNPKQEDHDGLYGRPPTYDNTHKVSDLSVLMPDVINKDGTIDLMRLVMKGTRKHRAMLSSLAKLDNDPTINSPAAKSQRGRNALQNTQFNQDVLLGEDSQSFILKEMNSVSKVRGPDEGNFPEQDSAYLNQSAYDSLPNSELGINSVASSVDTGSGEEGGVSRSFNDVVNDAVKMSTADSYGGQPDVPEGGMPLPGTPGGAAQANDQGEYFEDSGKQSNWGGEIKDLVTTAIYGGMDAITWRVEGGGGEVTDSFSNSQTQSPMASKFNSVVKEANNFKFDIAGGATGIGLVDGLINTFKDAAMGLAAGSVIGNVPLALAGNAYIKIPDHWDGSTSNLHKETYTINFNCTYAHPFEQIMKIWVPFSLFLPLVAGFSAGGAASTSPFYVKAFCQSRSIIRTGLVESCSFKFGAGEAGWTKERTPLNMSVDLVIVDLDPLVSVPIDRATSILDLTNPNAVVQRLLSDDTGYNNYLSRLTGVSYLDTVMKYSRLNRGLTQAKIDIRTSMSASNIAAKIIDSPVKDFAYLFTKPIQR